MKLLYQLFIIILIPLICLMGLAFIQFDSMFDQIESQHQNHIKGFAKNIKNHFRSAMSKNKNITEIISKNKTIQTAFIQNNTKQLCKKAREFRILGVYDIFFMDSSFNILCQTNHLQNISFDQPKLPIFQKAALSSQCSLVDIQRTLYIIAVCPIIAEHQRVGYVVSLIQVYPHLVDEIISHLQIQLKINYQNKPISSYLDNINVDSWEAYTFLFTIDDISLEVTLYENSIISQLLTKSRQSHLYFLLAILAVFISGIALFIRKLITPMNQLVNAMNKYSKGELKLSLLPNVQNEIGNLSHAFHRMIIDLEHAEQRFGRIFEYSIEGIFQIHPEGYFIRVNPALVKILGYLSPEELIESISDISSQMYVYSEDWERFKSMLLEQNQVKSFEVRLYQKDLSIIWVSINARNVRNRNGEIICYEGFLIDITERKSREEFEKERKALELANHTKSEFLANVSHEIRTPLNAVLGLGKLLYKTELNNLQKEYLDDILNSSKILLELINDILDYSKVELGNIQLVNTSFYLMDIYQNIISIFKQQIQTKKMAFVFHIPKECGIELIGDPIRIKQILINLLGNAVKFTDKGQVWIQTDSLHKTSGEIYISISVTDTGIGIDETDQHRIFQAFTQADASSTRKYSGTGLGLAICEKLVYKMKGKMYVTSIPTKGSTFSITIPLTYDENSNKPIKSPPVYSRILIIEDDEVNAKFVKSVFKNENMDIHILPDGQDIFQYLIQYSYDMIFMDIQLPGIDGYELSQHIRQSGRITLPIIALTACAMKGDREKCLAAGMNDYLPKPFEPEDVLAIYHKWKGALQLESRPLEKKSIKPDQKQ